MKFKHMLAICCSCVAVFALFVFNGCTKNGFDKITMDRYFNTQVLSTVVKNSGLKDTEKLKLSSFTGKNVDLTTLKKRNSLEFTGETSWLYGMYIDCIYITFYANKSLDLNQLRCTIIGLNAGDYDATLPEGSYKQEMVLSGKVSANSGYTFKIDVQKQVTNNEFKITLDLEDQVSDDFAWTIYDFGVYGETR